MSGLHFKIGEIVRDHVNDRRGSGRGLPVWDHISRGAWQHLEHVLQCSDSIFHSNPDVRGHHLVENVIQFESWNPEHDTWQVLCHCDDKHWFNFMRDGLRAMGIAAFYRNQVVYIVWRGEKAW